MDICVLLFNSFIANDIVRKQYIGQKNIEIIKIFQQIPFYSLCKEYFTCNPRGCKNQGQNYSLKVCVVLVCVCYAIIQTRSFCIIKPIKDTNFMIMHFITIIADYRTNEETFLLLLCSCFVCIRLLVISELYQIYKLIIRIV